MNDNVKVIYKDDAITVEEHKLGVNKSLIYMYDKSGQREFCMTKEQWDNIQSN